MEMDTRAAINRKLMTMVSVVTLLVSGLADGKETSLIYHKDTKNTLAEFQLFLEGPLQTQGRAQIFATPEGIKATPSERGGFTLYKFQDLEGESFDLRVVFRIPSGIRYANSGIYFLYTDPTVPIREELDGVLRQAYDNALQSATVRAERYGEGPYEADFFARELQIIAGFEPNLPADNHGAGAFYGVNPVPVGNEVPGTQGLIPYELVVGDTYELTVEARGLEVRTYLRSVNNQNQRVLVSRFLNVTRQQDPIRGGSPIALLLQAFPNNGTDVKSPVFEEIVIDSM